MGWGWRAGTEIGERGVVSSKVKDETCDAVRRFAVVVR